MARCIAVPSISAIAIVLASGVIAKAQKVPEATTVNSPSYINDSYADRMRGVAARIQSSAIFQPLGDLPGGDVLSVATGVSVDGAVIVGQSGSDGSGYEAFRWTETGGMVGLGDLFGSPMMVDSSGNDVSADGSVVVGQALSAVTLTGQAYRWTQATGMVGLGDLPGGSELSSAYAVSADGLVIVGYGNSASGEEAFRWTESEGMVALGDLPGGDFRSGASGVSDDGSVVVGSSEIDETLLEHFFEAFRWTESEGMVGLGDLPGGSFHSKASAVSADGSVVVGFGTSASGQEAFRWTEEEGMVGLGDFPGGVFRSAAGSVSADGSIVLGYGYSDSGLQTFIWDHVRGMRNLSDILVNHLGLDLTGWTGIHVGGLSTDGRVIIGDGTNPSGDTEAWRIVLPCDAHIEGCLGPAIPAVSEWGIVAMTLLVLTAGSLVLARRRCAPRVAG
jgi:probable HAF family extracellular repeat protein